MTGKTNANYVLYKRNGLYYVSFSIHSKRFRISSKCTVKAEANNLAPRIIQEKYDELYAAPVSKLSDLMSRYIDLIKTRNKDWHSKIHKLKLFFEFSGDKELEDITPMLCQEFINHLAKGNMTDATVNRYIATIKHMFNKALDWELIERNPMRRVKQFKEKPRMRFFSSSELERLIYSAKKLSRKRNSDNQTIFYYIMMVAIYTGMRLGEIIHLKWMDIRDNEFVIHNSKSGKKRFVPINDELFDILRELDSTSEYIFPLKRRCSDVITKIWHKVRKEAGIADGRFHDLRHTFGSFLIRAGVDVVTVKELLGHSDLKMTQIYVHSSSAQKRKAVGELKISNPFI